MPKKKTAAKRLKPNARALHQAKSQPPSANSQAPNADLRTYTIRDYRLEKPTFKLRQIVERKKDGAGDDVPDKVRYKVESGDLSAPAPPIRDSPYLTPKQCIEIYRQMDRPNISYRPRGRVADGQGARARGLHACRTSRSIYIRRGSPG